MDDSELAFFVGPLRHDLYNSFWRKYWSNNTAHNSEEDEAYRMTQDKTTDKKISGIPVVPRWFLTIVSLPIVVGLLWFGRGFLIPLALASLLFVLNIALIDRLNSATVFGRDVPRWIAYIGETTGLFILLSAFGYALSNQATVVAEAGPRYAERLA
ncbi:hypothetical protein C1J03_23550 (plasmid) [Sulfitobacter sp. SK012]|uniref:hypothetical protein n=1 Tax=Sulfitobacter sp. SK012 TaxID=1389005 RepID=UPI000E0BA817|nr:hypothetical protein C1J03_23550 [Sulfitobacter sp. SK012]